MRVGFVVQRYGLEVCGGAELLCRQVAEHMAAHWEVEVFTSCAQDYSTWENVCRPGTDELNGIPVHRYRVTEHRVGNEYERLSNKVFHAAHTDDEEKRWMRLVGPWVPDLPAALAEAKDSFDCFIFFTYLYVTTYYGLPVVKEKAFFLPTAHNEPPLRLRLFDKIFNAPKGFIYLSPEERALVHRRFRNAHIPGHVIGAGIEHSGAADGSRFRKKHGIHGPFMLYVGRIDQAKNCDQLFRYFQLSRDELASGHQLLLMGQAFMSVPEGAGIRHLGFVPDEDKFDALAAADLLVLPSTQESLSIVLLEAWSVGTPVLVNGDCDVLVGQCRRAQGGLWYHGREQFVEAVQYLVSNPDVRERMGRNGRQYVDANYRWDTIERKFLEFTASTLSQPAASA